MKSNKSTKEVLDNSNLKLNIIDMFGNSVEMDSFKLATKTEMIKDGENEVKEIVAKASNFSNSNILVSNYYEPRSARDYDRIDARDYARRHAKNYNSNYTSYKDINRDCANFVSQCIFAGGVTTDSVWKPDSVAWINTGINVGMYGVTDYMEDYGYFFESYDKYKAFAGSIVCFKY